MTDEEIAIVRIVAEKEEELDEEDMIVVRKMEEMVPRWFHKYLKVFEKKESERCYDQYLENTIWSWIEGMMTRLAAPE